MDTYPLSVCNGSNASGDSTTNELPQEHILHTFVSSGSKYQIHCVDGEELVPEASKHKACCEESIDPRIQPADVQQSAEVSEV